MTEPNRRAADRRVVRRGFPRHRGGSAWWLGLAAAVMAGCGEPKVDRSEAEKLFGPTTSPGAPTEDAWTIVIVAMRGEDAAAAARDGLWKVQTEAGLSQAYMERRGEAFVIAYGRYAGADDAQAVADLKRIQGIEVGGGRPFAGAMITPPMVEGSIPEFDLRNARRLHGDRYRYTLQVGVYSREDRPASEAELAEFRRTAERAVLDLRRTGEKAFYFHGPSRSMVTVGLFDDEGLGGLEMRQAKERHPHNLQNGRGVRQRIPEFPESDPRGWKIQPSFPVGVPGG